MGQAELNTIPEGAGVYELTVRKGEIDYPNGKSAIVYYGSTGNLKKRLTAYLNGYGHTARIRSFVDNNSLNMRTKQCIHHRETEAVLIHEFEEEMGALPLLNSVRPSLGVKCQ